MKQAHQHGEAFIKRGVRAIFRQLQGQYLAAGKQAECLADRIDSIPVRAGINGESVMFGEVLCEGRLTYGVMAFLQ